MQWSIYDHHHDNQHDDAQASFSSTVLEGHPECFHNVRFVEKVGQQRSIRRFLDFLLVHGRLIHPENAVHQCAKVHCARYTEDTVESDFSAQKEMLFMNSIRHSNEAQHNFDSVLDRLMLT